MTMFSATLAERDRSTVVAVAGELDIATTPALEEALEKAELGMAGVIVDLSATEFADSSGMTSVLRSAKRMHGAGRAFAVICPRDNAEVCRVIDLLGLHEAFAVHDSVDDAEASFPDGSG
jgi:anti-sigma B factor antagonist